MTTARVEVLVADADSGKIRLTATNAPQLLLTRCVFRLAVGHCAVEFMGVWDAHQPLRLVPGQSAQQDASQLRQITGHLVVAGSHGEWNGFLDKDDEPQTRVSSSDYDGKRYEVPKGLTYR
ncbi:hypothetical protein [Pseudomonas sp. RIT623]|uniref:hypothetical protein n=1 Tax=Pseudomonas sp. RIT623 TaxID=2559075 RepID=UPI00106FDFCC|nr:hypothetical protein [Pseudomonas sp. RIT623]TFF41759.1 hypothetical protein E3U47_08425 [Pseudomonas sp. RIT623]